MRDLFRLIGWMVVDLFRSRAALEAEIRTLRQQINVLRRTAPKRLSFSAFHRLVFAGLFSIIMPTVLRRWICSSSRQSRFVCSTAADHGAWPAADSMVWRHTASDCRMGRKPTHG